METFRLNVVPRIYLDGKKQTFVFLNKHNYLYY